METKLEMEILSDLSRLKEIYALRVLAFENATNQTHMPQNIYPNDYCDEMDESIHSTHWVVYDHDKIIAAARLVVLNDIDEIQENFEKYALPEKRPFAYWSKLVVHPDYRNLGLAKLLDNARKNYLAANPHINFALGCVSDNRKSAIEAMNFKHLGPVAFNTQNNKISLEGYIYLNNQ